MRSFFILFIGVLFSMSLFSQSERVSTTSTLNPVKCPTLSARPAYDLCATPTATIAPNVTIPPGATILYDWDAPGGAVINGGTDQMTLMTQSGGIYTLSASNSTSGCTAVRYYTVVACPVGIDENEDVQTVVSVYPNPCHTAFELSFNQSATLLIFDVFGELLLTKHHEPGKQIVDISQLVDGAYYVKIVSDSYTKTVKVLKD